MHNLIRVARHEYRKRVSKRSFFLGTLGFPALMIIVMTLIIIMGDGEASGSRLGYVDQAGVLLGAQPPQEDVDITPYPDEAAARQALESGAIQAYYLVPPNYLDRLQVSVFFQEEAPSDQVEGVFKDFMRSGLAAYTGAVPQVRERLIEDPDLTVRTADGSRQIGKGNFMNVLLPFFASFIFVFVVMTSAGYLLQVVADEKENRMVEVLITSITPNALIGGKAVGLMAVTLTQLAIWVGVAALVVLVGAQFVEPLRNVRFPLDSIGIILLYFLPAYGLIAGLMTAIGGATGELRQGQQIAGIINLLFMVPFFFVGLIFENPESPILLGLTLFPTTAFSTVVLRWSVHSVPLWQMALSWGLLVVSALISIWASARIFRAGMLLYGQGMSLRGAFAAVRQRS